jgi:hypothetical protein
MAVILIPQSREKDLLGFFSKGNSKSFAEFTPSRSRFLASLGMTRARGSE